MTMEKQIVLDKPISSLPGLDVSVTKAYGVKIDGYTSDTNPNLKEIGILAAFDEDDVDNLSLDVIDCILAYSTFDASVLLEIPQELNLEPSSLVIMAGTTRFDLSILPPTSLSEALSSENQDDADEYVDKIISYCRPWMNNPSSAISIYPFVGYFSYLVASELGHKPESITTDDYMDVRFVQAISESAMDYIKVKLTQFIHDEMGGEEEFKKYAHTLGAVLYKRVESVVEDVLTQNKEQESSSGEKED